MLVINRLVKNKHLMNFPEESWYIDQELLQTIVKVEIHWRFIFVWKITELNRPTLHKVSGEEKKHIFFKYFDLFTYNIKQTHKYFRSGDPFQVS